MPLEEAEEATITLLFAGRGGSRAAVTPTMNQGAMQDMAQVLVTSPGKTAPVVPVALAVTTVGLAGTRTEQTVTVAQVEVDQAPNAQVVEVQPDKAATVLAEVDHMCPLGLED